MGYSLAIDAAPGGALLLKDPAQGHSSSYKYRSLDTEFHPESLVSGVTRLSPLSRLSSTCSLLLVHPSVRPQAPGQRRSQARPMHMGRASLSAVLSYSERQPPLVPGWHPLTAPLKQLRVSSNFHLAVGSLGMARAIPVHARW